MVAPTYSNTYIEYGEDDETTITSTTIDQDVPYINSPPMDDTTFEQEIQTENAAISQAAYFLDGGHRFISVRFADYQSPFFLIDLSIH